jgi:hypothetical protein
MVIIIYDMILPSLGNQFKCEMCAIERNIYCTYVIEIDQLMYLKVIGMDKICQNFLEAQIQRPCQVF